MKKLLALLCALTVTACMSLSVFAADKIMSPVSSPDTSASTGDSKSPQTGDGNVLIYAAGAVVVSLTTAVIAKKKLSAK